MILGHALFAAAAVLASCAAPASEEGVMRIAVMRDGAILLDGRAIDRSDVDALMDAAAERGDVVWYYREAPEAEATPAAEASMTVVLEAVMQRRLPISLSSQPDYSDIIDAQGKSGPRS